ncbi:hypothetical protein DICA3_B09714 [Diutina catenulata]
MMPYPRVPLSDKTALRNHPSQKAMPLDLARDDFGMAGMAGMAGVPLKSTAAASVALDSMYTAHPAGRTASGESLTSADTSADYGASVAGAGASAAGAAGAGAPSAASGAAAPGHAPPGSSASASSSFASSSFAATTPQSVFAPPPPLMLSPAFSSPPKAPLFIDPATTKPREKRRKKTKKELKEEAFDLSSEEKPPYSYATLIGISILSHHDKKLTLSQIYAWISHTFKYYKREDVGWQNSIRHNLSLNKAFVKGDKSKDGKGHFWCIKPGCEDQFLKSKSVRKSSYHEVMDQLHRRAPLPTSPPPEPPAKRARLGAPFADWDDMAPAPGASAPADPAPRPGAADDAPRPGAATTAAAAAAPDPEGAYPTFALGLASSPERLAYPSAFALELSPARPAATGPILEPLTPGLLRMKAPPLLKPPANPLPHLSPRGHLSPRPSPRAAATPHQATPQTKTPLRALRTPQTHGRRLWNSPSYLEEFYSPLVHSNHRAVFNSYDDDELVLRPWPSPGRRRATQSSPVTSRNLMGDLRRAESGGGSPGRRGSCSGTATDADE